jgi:hypothetical protein
MQISKKIQGETMKLALIPSAILCSSLLLEITAALAVSSCAQGPQGPPGPAGPIGATGLTGPAGPAGTFSTAGVITVVQTLSVNSSFPNSFFNLDVNCPADHPVAVAGAGRDNQRLAVLVSLMRRQSFGLNRYRPIILTAHIRLLILGGVSVGKINQGRL